MSASRSSCCCLSVSLRAQAVLSPWQSSRWRRGAAQFRPVGLPIPGPMQRTQSLMLTSSSGWPAAEVDPATTLARLTPQQQQQQRMHGIALQSRPSQRRHTVRGFSEHPAAGYMFCQVQAASEARASQNCDEAALMLPPCPSFELELSAVALLQMQPESYQTMRINSAPAQLHPRVESIDQWVGFPQAVRLLQDGSADGQHLLYSRACIALV